MYLKFDSLIEVLRRNMLFHTLLNLENIEKIEWKFFENVDTFAKLILVIYNIFVVPPTTPEMEKLFK